MQNVHPLRQVNEEVHCMEILFSVNQILALSPSVAHKIRCLFQHLQCLQALHGLLMREASPPSRALFNLVARQLSCGYQTSFSQFQISHLISQTVGETSHDVTVDVSAQQFYLLTEAFNSVFRFLALSLFEDALPVVHLQLCCTLSIT